MIVDSVTDLIGDTPLLRIPERVHGCENVDLYAKLEMFNPFGSVKDRIAWKMIGDQLDGLAEGGVSIVENSSGNTAKAIVALASQKGIPFKLVSALVKVRETKDVLKLLGADIEEIIGALNCFDPNDPNDPQYIIQRVVRESNGKIFFPSQFTNPRNPEAHYEGTGAEILRDLGSVDIISSGLGTSGSTLGIANRLREGNPELVCLGTVSGKQDFIPGLRSMDQMWESGFFRRDAYNEFIEVTSLEALDGMLALIRGTGLLCGPSSGANFAGVLKHLRAKSAGFDRRMTVVFLACDRVEGYLSYIRERRPELFGEKPLDDSLVTLSVEEIAEAPSLPVKDAAGWIASANPLIVDVRSNLAYALGSIAEAVNIPIELLERLVEGKANFAGGRPVLFVCQSGIHTRKFAAYFARRGDDARNLEGGLLQWRASGLPLPRGGADRSSGLPNVA